MDKHTIKNVPFFKSEYHPYSCTEASCMMVYGFFCGKELNGKTQYDIEDAGARTYEGGLECVGSDECVDLGAEGFFKNLDFKTERYENPSFELIRCLLLEKNIPFVLRMHQKKKSDGRHTVVVVGYQNDDLLIHDPDGKAYMKLKVPNRKYDITSLLIASPNSRCKNIRPYPPDKLKKTRRGRR